MKKMMKKFIATFLVVAIILCSAPLSGLVGLELPAWLDFSIESSASGYIRFSTDGQNATITEFWDIYGEYTVPSTINDGSKIYTVIGIGAFAFKQSPEITKVIIPDSVTTIGEFAFSNCKSLQSVIIGNGVTKIEKGAFLNCTLLDDIIISNNVKTIGEEAFEQCESLTNVCFPDSVENIGDLTFFNCISLKKIELGNNVKEIGQKAFYQCYSLKEIRIPNSTTVIDKYAFYSCSNLQYVILGDNITSIGDYAFYNCISISSINIPNSVLSIGNRAFNKCKSLAYLEIGNGVTSIGECSFAGCQSLENIVIPNNVTLIGNGAFMDCTNIQDATIGIGITNISNLLFSGCTQLSNVILPDSLTSIGSNVFAYCTSLKSISIPKGVKSIDDYAFLYCTGLYRITVDKDNEYYSNDEYGVLFDKEKTELIQYPASMLLSFYYIPSGVTNISCAAFACCKTLKTLIIPKSVYNVSVGAFLECANLMDVYYEDTEEAWGRVYIDNEYNYNDSLLNATFHFNQSYNHKCDFQTLSHNETEHPHYAVYKCECGSLSIVTTETTTINSCDVCNPHVHTKVSILAVPATCTTAGSTAGTECSVCGEILTAPTVIPATGHNYSGIITPPTCTNGGYTTYTCANCGDSYVSDETPALGHNYATFSHYESAHPHYAVYKCSCGVINVTTQTGKIDDCELCNPPEEHTHTPKLVRIEPTCTVNGMEYTICKECGETLGDTTILPAGHKPKDVRIEPTCTVNGMEYTICEECGETIGDTTILPAGHVWGEWYVALEPTIYADGREERKCSRCNETESRVIPKLAETIKDDESGIELVIPNEAYDEDIKLEIEEVYDGASFQIVDGLGNVSETKIFDITTTLNGVVVQPNTTLTVRIPLPAGYDPNRTFIYHVNSETGAVENMKARYEDGYLVFETNHFSHYAIVEMGEEYNYTFSIQTPSQTTIRCKDGIILHANLNGTYPEGTRIEWTSSNGNFDKSVVDGNSLKIISKDKGYTTFTATLYDVDGNIIAQDSVEIYSKAGFFDKIGGFFRNLFKTTTIYEN